MDRLIAKLFRFTSLYVLGVYRYDDSERYQLLKICKKGAKLSFVSFGSYGDVASVAKNTDLRKPFIAVVDGKGILNKIISLSSEADTNWRKNLDFATLYHTEYKTPDTTFLSFSRRQPVDALLAVLHHSGFQVIDVHIGPLAAVHLQASIGDQAMYSNETLLKFDNGILMHITKSMPAANITYTVGGETLIPWEMPLFGAAAQYYLRPEGVDKSNMTALASEEVLYRRAFNTVGA